MSDTHAKPTLCLTGAPDDRIAAAQVSVGRGFAAFPHIAARQQHPLVLQGLERFEFAPAPSDASGGVG